MLGRLKEEAASTPELRHFPTQPALFRSAHVLRQSRDFQVRRLGQAVRSGAQQDPQSCHHELRPATRSDHVVFSDGCLV